MDERFFLWTNHNPLLRIATNEFASFWIDNRLPQIDIFVFVKVGEMTLFRIILKDFEINKFFSILCFFII